VTSATDVVTRPPTLLSRYRGVICDLDGVVYRGSKAVPNAIQALNAAVADGTPVTFATNNASRAPAAVADHLRELGLTREGWSVVTSSQAAAAHLAGLLEPGTQVLAVGGPGVPLALHEAGLVPVRATQRGDTSQVVAVVQGAGLDVTWRDLAEVGYLAEGGALWVATNLDETVPTSRGRAPGNGALVAAVRTATTAVPQVVGKPGAALFDLARARLGTDRGETIVVGDRLETDIQGARAAGLDSLFVLGGASTLRDVAFAEASTRPTHVAFDLSGLLRPALLRDDDHEDDVEVTPDGEVVVRRPLERHRLLRAVVHASWGARDAGRALSADTEPWEALERRLGVPRH